MDVSIIPRWSHSCQSQNKKARALSASDLICKNGRAPPVDPAAILAAFHQSDAETLVTPVRNCLGLLPPGPDPVHRLTPHEIHAVTLMVHTSDRAGPRGGVRPRYSGLRVQGTASSPSSTTMLILPDSAGFVNTLELADQRLGGYRFPFRTQIASPDVEAGY